MKKRWFLFGVLFLLVSCLLAGCGVKQELHDAVVADLGTAQAELQSVKAQLGEIQTELKATEDELAVKKNELGSSQTEMASLVEERESLTAEKASLQADYDKLSDENSTVKQELAEIKEVYPPRDFSSLKELQDWLLANDISNRPSSTTAESLYSKALTLQEDALKDGYIISVDIDSGERLDEYSIACVTIIDGDIWAWDPEDDEPINFSQLAEFMKVK